jgi:hypothetical protein
VRRKDSTWVRALKAKRSVDFPRSIMTGDPGADQQHNCYVRQDEKNCIRAILEVEPIVLLRPVINSVGRRHRALLGSVRLFDYQRSGLSWRSPAGNASEQSNDQSYARDQKKQQNDLPKSLVVDVIEQLQTQPCA